MDKKIWRKNMFLTDQIALFGFRVDGLFYPIEKYIYSIKQYAKAGLGLSKIFFG